MNILQQTARRLEPPEALDKVTRPLAGAVGRAVRPPGLAERVQHADQQDPLHR
jgi:hypothetical protein